jgi:hypothetical protein
MATATAADDREVLAELRALRGDVARLESIVRGEHGGSPA